MSIRPPSPRLSQSSPRHLSFFSLSPLFSCSTLYVSTCAKIKREREGEDLPINLPTYLPTYLPTGCYLVTRRGLRLYDSPAVDDVVAPGVGVISTREGTYPPITVTSFSPLLPTVSPFLFRSPSLPRFVARNISSPHPSLLPVEQQQQPSREFPSRIVGMTRRKEERKTSARGAKRWPLGELGRMRSRWRVIPLPGAAGYCLCKFVDESRPVAIAPGIIPGSA